MELRCKSVPLPHKREKESSTYLCSYQTYIISCERKNNKSKYQKDVCQHDTWCRSPYLLQSISQLWENVKHSMLQTNSENHCEAFHIIQTNKTTATYLHLLTLLLDFFWQLIKLLLAFSSSPQWLWTSIILSTHLQIPHLQIPLHL